ncbi:Caleosin related protein-domain-containing protein [Chlamydoabsidia padenii]|nr:Caleosin related protein-domain-containing protein [Chlamydoabsidia padenii]
MANAAVEKHTKFWDRKNKGYITPVDAVFGFIHLGYGIIVSVTLGTFLGVLVSYSTQDTWMPDPMCRTRMEKLQKISKDAPYDLNGQLDMEKFDKLFDKYAKSDISGKTITLKELMEWNEATYKDPLTWSTNALESFAIYLLVGNKGVVKREDVQAAYDGTLFYKVRDRNKQHRTLTNATDSKSKPTSKSSSSTSLNISGVMVPKTYVRQLETQLNNAVSILPRSTVVNLETRLRNWLSFVQQQQQQQQQLQLRQPILKGVSTPAPFRRSLFGYNEQEEETTREEEVSSSPSAPSLFTGGLTGVLTINLLDQPMALTGVQGYEHVSDKGDSDEGETLDKGLYYGGLSGLKHSLDNDDDANAKENNKDELGTYHLAGVRPEGEAYYQDSPQIDYLRTGPLTGVSPSPTMNLLHEEEDDEDNNQLTGLQSSTPSLTDQGSLSSDQPDMVPKEQPTTATPPFAGSPNTQDDDDEDDLPHSPSDGSVPDSNETDDPAIKPHASWTPLAETVSGDN